MGTTGLQKAVRPRRKACSNRNTCADSSARQSSEAPWRPQTVCCATYTADDKPDEVVSIMVAIACCTVGVAPETMVTSRVQHDSVATIDNSTASWTTSSESRTSISTSSCVFLVEAWSPRLTGSDQARTGGNNPVAQPNECLPKAVCAVDEGTPTLIHKLTSLTTSSCICS